MKLISFILILFLITPFVYAEGVLVKTNVTINAVSWYDISSNVTRMNITIFTENIDGDKNIIINEVNSIFNNAKDIKFVRDLSCGNTTSGQLNSYFTECDGGVCRDKYFECKSGKDIIKQVKDECDSDLTSVNIERDSLKGNISSYDNKILLCENDLNLCSASKINCETESKNKIEWSYVILIGIVAGIWYWNKHLKRKGKKGEEEKRGSDYDEAEKQREFERALG